MLNLYCFPKVKLGFTANNDDNINDEGDGRYADDDVPHYQDHVISVSFVTFA